MLTLKLIQASWPRQGKNTATTGRIPMEVFEKNEEAIRKVMREHKLKAIYRGARLSNGHTRHPWGNTPTMTRRCDATDVMLYRK